MLSACRFAQRSEGLGKELIGGSHLQRVLVVIKVFGTDKAAAEYFRATSLQHEIGVDFAVSFGCRLLVLLHLHH